MAALALGVFGALIGSFLNVVVYRVPLGRSIVSPPSACGSCGRAVRPYDNIPLLSWLVLRGRCRDCASPISVRYPLVELGAAVLFFLVAVRFLPGFALVATTPSMVGNVLTIVAFLYLASISLVLALIDIDVHRLPNVIVLPAYIVGPALLGAASLLLGDTSGLVRGGIGLLALGALYLLLAVIRPGGMGMGDVKLAGVLGFFLGWLGWDALVVGAIGGFLLGGLYGVVLLAARRARAQDGVPFGPWMLGGAWVGILAGQPITTWYLSLFGLGGS